MAQEKTAAPPARDMAADKTDEAARPQRHPREHRPHREKGEHAKTDNGPKPESPKAEPVAPVAAAPIAAVPAAESPAATAPPPAPDPSTALAVVPTGPVEVPVAQAGQSQGHHPHAQRQLHPGEQRRKQQQQGKQAGPTLDLVELKDKSILDLNTIAKEMGVLNAAGLRKQN